MTYQYSDIDGDGITVRPAPATVGGVFIKTDPDGCYIDPDRLEELVAGIRDTARQAARRSEGAAT